ncbi:MAG: class I SAM-dependent methyltransferase [Sylvanvirus sp.]|uniref:Class I SAM-dependent methyltransferase n=1 Tax=Sylvanvirus sp. TaxID=2487774 RepID=A0A3G5AKG4_9VIRU|nr:MAG: class I SAM-dependent methyltransferase [Sylvanvirus sp.]
MSNNNSPTQCLYVPSPTLNPTISPSVSPKLLSERSSQNSIPDATLNAATTPSISPKLISERSSQNSIPDDKKIVSNDPLSLYHDVDTSADHESRLIQRISSNTHVYSLQVGVNGYERLRLLNLIHNHLTLQFIKSRVPLSIIMRVLDVGTGTGEMAMILRKSISTEGIVLAIDSSAEQINGARDKYKHSGLLFETADIATYNCSEPFDLIYCRLVLAHVKDPEQAVERLVSLLRPGGYLVIEESFELDSMFCIPPHKAFDLFKECCRLQEQVKGAKFSVGSRIYQSLQKMDNVQCEAVSCVQPCLNTEMTKSQLRLGLMEIKDLVVNEMGEKKFEDIERGLKDLEKDPVRMVALFRVIQLCYTKKMPLIKHARSYSTFTKRKTEFHHSIQCTLQPMDAGDELRFVQNLKATFAKGLYSSGQLLDEKASNLESAARMDKLYKAQKDTSTILKIVDSKSGQSTGHKSLGYCWYFPKPEILDKVARLGLLFIDSPYRDQGIGKSVMHLLFSRLKVEGYTGIELNVFHSNAAGRALYLGCGFKTFASNDFSSIMYNHLGSSLS